jgi:hypothetical protein
MELANTKQIILANIRATNIVTSEINEKTHQTEKKKRLIAVEGIFNEMDLNPENQTRIINELFLSFNNSKNEFVQKQLSQKIYSYRSQDILKGLFDPERFVDLETVVRLLYNSKLVCFYCKHQVKILYEFVRESEQWSLDRIDNQFGHNRDNVMIACLGCNLKRRTMYHERYAFTKQMRVLKTE